MILLPDRKEPLYYRKITRSRYDAQPLRRGNRLVRFIDRDGNGFGVLICYDYSHFDVVHRLNLERRIKPLDLLIVVAHNHFSSLYRSCCIADSHRFYQYIAMCNVACYGGSGLFGPMRLKGDRQIIAEAGKGAESVIVAELDIDGLRKARSMGDKDLQKGDFQRRPGIFQWRAEWQAGEWANEPTCGSD